MYINCFLYIKQDINNCTLMCYYGNVLFVAVLFFVCSTKNAL
jgi:hypothetical protein